MHSEAEELASRASRGAAALITRQVLVYGSNIGCGIALARFLSPAEFGFYGIVLFFAAFLNVFGGTGFAANLIRAGERPTTAELRAVFTAQQLLVAGIFAIILFSAPWLAEHYRMQHGGRAFFSLIGLALALTSLMVISQVLMERELAFGKLAAVEVSQALAFNAVAIVLAWRGFGVLSFAIALAVRAACGAVLSWIVEPWPVGWRWDPFALNRHLRFGLALQTSQLISLAKDSITPLFVGLYLGAGKMGYVTWACTLAGYPTMVLTPLQRLYLPLFARLQVDRVALRTYAARAMWISNAVAAPLVTFTIALAHPITTLIFGDKWLPALPLFYLLAAANAFAAGSAPMLGLLNAAGKSHFTLALALGWMTATWALGIPLMLRFGFIGFGFATLAAQSINIGLYRAVRREISLSAIRTCSPSWPIALGVGSFLALLQFGSPIRGLVPLAASGTAALLIYAAILWFGFPSETGTANPLQSSPSWSTQSLLIPKDNRFADGNRVRSPQIAGEFVDR